MRPQSHRSPLRIHPCADNIKFSPTFHRHMEKLTYPCFRDFSKEDRDFSWIILTLIPQTTTPYPSGFRNQPTAVHKWFRGTKLDLSSRYKIENKIQIFFLLVSRITAWFDEKLLSVFWLFLYISSDLAKSGVLNFENWLMIFLINAKDYRTL